MTEDDDIDLNDMSQSLIDEITRIEEEMKIETVATFAPALEEVREIQTEEDALANLSDDQRLVYNAAIDGYNMFFTGDAGTGKSFVLRLIVSKLKEMYGSDRVFVTASTGIAACNINGTTLHSFAGIGLGDDSINKCVHRVLQNKKAKERWQKCEVLIIDEISMLDGRLFDKLEAVARQVRGDGHVFGGIQIIICGDFFQLPPVNLGKDGVIYCFESETWNSAIQKTLIMKKVFRQKDTRLQSLLRDIRYGKVNASSNATLLQMERNNLDGKGVIPTKLFVKNKSVDDFNNDSLKRLSGEAVVYTAVDQGRYCVD